MKNTQTILVVDDDAPARAMLGLSLRKAGFNVSTSAGGDEALQFLKDRRFDWMITDAKMFPINGFELSKRAKQFQPHLRIALTSALYTEKDVQNYPIDKFFPKPLSIDQLLEAIAKQR